MSWQPAFADLAVAHGPPVMTARFKQSNEDFVVEEELGFVPDGDGEHEFLYVEKKGMTTPQAQMALAQAWRLPLQRISYAGLKDKLGITRQWFSLHDARCEQKGELPLSMRVLHRVRNRRKLQRGSHRSNRFVIVLRDCQTGDEGGLQARLAAIRELGVPNYFGEQRFGRDEDNLAQASRWFADKSAAPRQRHVRGLLLSAVRSFLFNAVLSERVASGSWNRILTGEVVALAGTAATFAGSRATAAELQERLNRFDIHPTGPLWGAGQSACSEEVAQLEQGITSRYPQLTDGLLAQGLRQERRSLRLQVSDLSVVQQNNVVTLDFRLTRGAYATVVLRELIKSEAVA